MSRTPTNSTRSAPLRVLFLITRRSDGTDEERAGVQRAVHLRDEIRAGRVRGVTLVGPTRDTKPSTWTAKMRRYAGRVDVVIIEGHGLYLTGPDSCLRAPWREYVIGTGDTYWRPYLDCQSGDPVSVPLVVLGSCWARRHVHRIGPFFADGQAIVSTTRIAHAQDVDLLYEPLLGALAAGHPIEPVLAAAPKGWALTITGA